VISVANNGHTDAIDAMATLNSSSTDIVINNGSFNMGGIAMGASQEATFNISVDDNINPGVSIQFEFNVDADGYTAYKEFFLVAGQIPVLIVDLDPNNSSAPEMNLCFGNLNVGADYATSIPADLPMYSSVFVCLGIYNANTALSSTDGQALADYLAGGGNLYMEGGDTWYYDAQTAVHPMFGITGIEDGTDDLGTLLGQTGTFTEGMTYSYGGENNWIDHIAPNGSAFLIFNNESPSYGTGVANIGSTYRTIGCSHEFGGLEDGAFTKDYLMYKYLQFFGIDAIWVGLEEIALSENAISIYPNPVTNSAMVRVNVAEAGTLSLAVFNSKGQKISVLADNKAVTVGEQGFEFDASAVPGGIYYCVLSSGDQKVTKKIVVIK
jgi:hypothetical protein